VRLGLRSPTHGKPYAHAFHRVPEPAEPLKSVILSGVRADVKLKSESVRHDRRTRSPRTQNRRSRREFRVGFGLAAIDVDARHNIASLQMDAYGPRISVQKFLGAEKQRNRVQSTGPPGRCRRRGPPRALSRQSDHRKPSGPLILLASDARRRSKNFRFRNAPIPSANPFVCIAHPTPPK
jgi:hypothetical protein